MDRYPATCYNLGMSNRYAIDIGKSSAKLVLLAASIAMMCVGCMLESDREAPAAAADKTPNDALRSQPRNPDVPLGCSKVWSVADADSVLYCPEYEPPSGPG
jgi:hypothetical protein